MATVTSINGQSVFDLVLQVYGSYDNMVSFCITNGITNINYVPQIPTTFTYDPSLITDGRTNNYVYVTAIQPNFYITEDGSEYYETEDGSGYYIPE